MNYFSCKSPFLGGIHALQFTFAGFWIGRCYLIRNWHQIFHILICCYFHFSVWIKGHPFLIEPLAWHKSAATNPAVWNNSKNTAKPSQKTKKQKISWNQGVTTKLTIKHKKKPIQDSFNYRIASWCEDKIVWIHKNSAPPPSNHLEISIDLSGFQ